MFINSDPHNNPVKLITIIMFILQIKGLHKAQKKKKKKKERTCLGSRIST